MAFFAGVYDVAGAVRARMASALGADRILVFGSVPRATAELESVEELARTRVGIFRLKQLAEKGEALVFLTAKDVFLKSCRHLVVVISDFRSMAVAIAGVHGVLNELLVSITVVRGGRLEEVLAKGSQGESAVFKGLVASRQVAFIERFSLEQWPKERQSQ